MPRLITMFKILVSAFILSFLSGCAITPDFTNAVKPTTAVQLDKLYIYSFLDIRASELGATLMSEIERQLGKELKTRGVQSEQHWLMRDPIGAELSQSGFSTVRIPVLEVIAGNTRNEQAYGAKYRLTIFPAKTTIAGAWRYYDFTWLLQDSFTQRTIWTITSQSKHMNWGKNDENSTERAKVLVDALMQQMESAQLLRKPAVTLKSAQAPTSQP